MPGRRPRPQVRGERAQWCQWLAEACLTYAAWDVYARPVPPWPERPRTVLSPLTSRPSQAPAGKLMEQIGPKQGAQHWLT